MPLPMVLALQQQYYYKNIAFKFPCFAFTHFQKALLTNGSLSIFLNSTLPMEFNSNPFINSIHHFYSKPSLLSTSHPLFSTIVTLYTLILLYAPSLFLRIVLSPVINSTGIILLLLLKLGANERMERESNCLEPRVLDHKDEQHEQLTSLEQRFLDLVDQNQTHRESHQMQAEFEHDLGSESNSQGDGYKWELLDIYSMESSSQVVEIGETRMELDSKQVDTTMKFLKWNMKAPLEIIYEAYEGEEEEEEDEDSNEYDMVYRDKHVSGLDRYPSLSMYYPKSETDISSDDDFPMNEKWETREREFFKWEKEDDDREELIEISVDRYERRSNEFCHVEEDNLIEIDIFSGEKLKFYGVHLFNRSLKTTPPPSHIINLRGQDVKFEYKRGKSLREDLIHLIRLS